MMSLPVWSLLVAAALAAAAVLAAAAEMPQEHGFSTVEETMGVVRALAALQLRWAARAEAGLSGDDAGDVAAVRENSGAGENWQLQQQQKKNVQPQPLWEAVAEEAALLRNEFGRRWRSGPCPPHVIPVDASHVFKRRQHPRSDEQEEEEEEDGADDDAGYAAAAGEEFQEEGGVGDGGDEVLTRRNRVVPEPLRSALRAAEREIGAAALNTAGTAVSCVAGGASYGGLPFWHVGLGRTNASMGAPERAPGPGTTFRVGSVTKLFVAAQLFALAEQGKLPGARGLDGPISAAAPAFARMPDPWRRSGGSSSLSLGSGSSDRGATWREVVSQLGGLAREAPCDLSPTGEFSCNVTSAQMFERLATSSSYILPRGQHPSYSNLGFSLLGNVLAESVAKPATTFDAYLSQQIAAPLGMKTTGISLTPEAVQRHAVGYSAPGVAVPFRPHLGWDAPSGDAYSCVRDMLLFMDVFADTYRPLYEFTPRFSPSQPVKDALLSRSTALEMMQPVFVNPGIDSAFASPFETVLAKPYIIRTKGGNVPGYSSLVGVVPSLRFSFAFFFNGRLDEEKVVMPSILGKVLPALEEVLRRHQPRMPIVPPVTAPFEGTYKSAAGNQLVVSMRELDGRRVLHAVYNGVTSMPLTWVKRGSATEEDAAAAVQQMQIYVPPSVAKESCLDDELLALDHQFVTFSAPAPLMPATRVQLFGVFPGQVFQRLP